VLESTDHELLSDKAPGRECLGYYSFWEWDHSSCLLFWCWTEETRRWARDGLPIWLHPDQLPAQRVVQRVERDPRIKKQVAKKLSKFVQRGYLAPGTIQSLINYFPVAKREDDVRMMFDRSNPGLKSAIWAPSFTLPMVDSLLPKLDVGTWQANIDVSEMFYNYLTQLSSPIAEST
jgi:hypothetical protein